MIYPMKPVLSHQYIAAVAYRTAKRISFVKNGKNDFATIVSCAHIIVSGDTKTMVQKTRWSPAKPEKNQVQP